MDNKQRADMIDAYRDAVSQRVAFNSTENRTAETAAREALLGPTAEDIYACCKSTLIGFDRQLTTGQIEFLCDQISRKATMQLSTPGERGGRS